jgi:hypothetical protein
VVGQGLPKDSGQTYNQSSLTKIQRKVLPNLDAIYTIGSNCNVVNIVSYITRSFLGALILVTIEQDKNLIAFHFYPFQKACYMV